ncbi:hypothetical protein [Nocardia sp. IFM 10818]
MISKGAVLELRSEVLDFTIPPRVGGELGLDNVDVMDFVTAAGMAGQIHDQLRFAPEGTAIQSDRTRQGEVADGEAACGTEHVKGHRPGTGGGEGRGGSAISSRSMVFRIAQYL